MIPYAHLPASSACACAAAIRFRPQVQAADGRLSLGEAADLAALPAPLRARAASLVVARLPLGGPPLATPVARLAARSRALMPELAPWLPAHPEGVVLVRPAPAPAPTPSRGEDCVRVLAPIAPGAAADTTALAPAPCAPESASGFRYQARGQVPRARRALAVGEVVAGAPRAFLSAVTPGDRITVAAQVGPVRIERQVEALQAARPGGRLFVRGQDGAVFATTVPEEKP